MASKGSLARLQCAVDTWLIMWPVSRTSTVVIRICRRTILTEAVGASDHAHGG